MSGRGAGAAGRAGRGRGCGSSRAARGRGYAGTWAGCSGSWRRHLATLAGADDSDGRARRRRRACDSGAAGTSRRLYEEAAGVGPAGVTPAAGVDPQPPRSTNAAGRHLGVF